MTEYLSAEHLLVIARRVLGAQPVVRDYGLLEAACARPQTRIFGSDAYADDWAKAAALGHSVISGHPLLDGNERLGWVGMRVFLELNGHEPFRAAVDDAENFVLAIASGELDDISEIAKRLRALADH